MIGEMMEYPSAVREDEKMDSQQITRQKPHTNGNEESNSRECRSPCHTPGTISDAVDRARRTSENKELDIVNHQRDNLQESTSCPRKTL